MTDTPLQNCGWLNVVLFHFPLFNMLQQVCLQKNSEETMWLSSEMFCRLWRNLLLHTTEFLSCHGLRVSFWKIKDISYVDKLPLVNGQNMAYIINRNMPLGGLMSLCWAQLVILKKKERICFINLHTILYHHTMQWKYTAARPLVGFVRFNCLVWDPLWSREGTLTCFT